MSIKYHKKYHALLEALGVLSRYYEDYDFDKLRQSLQSKSGYTNNTEHIIKIMSKVYKEVTNGMNFPDELSIYFKPLDNAGVGNDLANVIFSEVLIADDDVDIQSHASKLFHDDPSLFANVFLNYDEPVKKITSMQELMKELDTLDISDNMKWHYLSVYTNFDEHLEKLMTVINPLIERINQVYPKYESEFDDFHEFWDSACKDGSFCEKFKSCTKIDISKDEDDITLYPNYMIPNSIRLCLGLKNRNYPRLFLGLLFQTTCFVQEKQLTRDEILSRLKVLSDSSKYEIMMALKSNRQYGAEIAKHMNLSTATISHHVNSLCNFGLLNIEKDSNRVYYSLNKDQVSHLLDAIQRDLLED